MKLPDSYSPSFGTIVDRELITRPMDETPAQEKARKAKGLPAPMVSYVVGRIGR